MTRIRRLAATMAATMAVMMLLAGCGLTDALPAESNSHIAAATSTTTTEATTTTTTATTTTTTKATTDITTTKATTTVTTPKATTTTTTTKLTTTTGTKTTAQPRPTVYITPTGKCYHFSSSCAGKNAHVTTWENATAHYRACQKCAGG